MARQWYKEPYEEADVTLSDVLTEGTLRQLAGGRSFEFGRQYFEQGHVRDLAYDPKTLSATVVGSEDYRVRLGVLEDDLDYDCTCPFASDGAFCKHCVAAGVAWLSKIAKGECPDSLTGIREFLEHLDKPELIRMVLEQALQDPDFRSDLTLRLAAGTVKGAAPDVEALRAAIDSAAAVDYYIAYEAVAEHALGLSRIVTAIQNVLMAGHAKDALELAEYAIDAIEVDMEQIDNSNGEINGILGELSGIHLQAARANALTPEELARDLFTLEMTTDWTEFDLNDYQETLGENGLAEYRRVAEETWNEIQNSPSGELASGQPVSYHRLEEIMLSYAEESGDVEQTIRILTRDLSRPDRFRSIAYAYSKAGQIENAISWAEGGIKAFPSHGGLDLNGLLVQLYQKAGRHDDALKILWDAFNAYPALHAYIPLQKYTQPIDRWGEWRDKAWKVLRKPSASKQSVWGRVSGRDSSEIIEILLWEGKEEEAWQEAQAGGCSNDLWLKLADLRENDHPEDTLAIYRQRVAPLVEAATGYYGHPVEYLVKIKSLMDRLNRAQEFRLYIAALRDNYKRKRNFVKLLDDTFR